MPWRDVPAFYKRLTKLNSDDGRALRFTILTGARTDEVIGAEYAEYKGEITKHPATWGEIEDVDGVVTWIIPKERMKGKRTHHVPLSPAAVTLLGKRRADNIPLFDVSSQNALLATLKATAIRYTASAPASPIGSSIRPFMALISPTCALRI